MHDLHSLNSFIELCVYYLILPKNVVLGNITNIIYSHSMKWIFTLIPLLKVMNSVRKLTELISNRVRTEPKEYEPRIYFLNYPLPLS